MIHKKSNEIKRQLNMDCALISRVCLGKKGYRTAYGFNWQYREVICIQ